MNGNGIKCDCVLCCFPHSAATVAAGKLCALYPHSDRTDQVQYTLQSAVNARGGTKQHSPRSNATTQKQLSGDRVIRINAQVSSMGITEFDQTDRNRHRTSWSVHPREEGEHSNRSN